MKALLMSADPDVREQMRVSLRAVERRTDRPWSYLEAPDGIEAIRMAWRERPDVVMVDEIASRAGAFAVVKDLRGAEEPLRGVIVVALARAQDAWLARWAGADAWFTHPLDPFAIANAVADLLPREAG